MHVFACIFLNLSFMSFPKFDYMTKNTPFFPILHVFAPLNDVRAYSAWSWKTTLITWIFGRAWYPPWHSSAPPPRKTGGKSGNSLKKEWRQCNAGQPFCGQFSPSMNIKVKFSLSKKVEHCHQKSLFTPHRVFFHSKTCYPAFNSYK